MPVYTLSLYADYACRHSGACCTAGWAIPVESSRVSVVGAALLVPQADGACVHFDRGSGLCRLHRDHGEDALPRSCFQFPRRALIDDRGTFVTLSNFCPTAAALLCDDGGPLGVVTDPRAFPGSREYDGLDARGHWPPLVRPGLLFDLDTYAAWERFIVEMLGTDRPLDEVLGQLADAVERLRGWTPERGPFAAWAIETMRLTTAHPATRSTVAAYRSCLGTDLHARVRSFVPAGLDLPAAPPLQSTAADSAWLALASIVNRYIASKAFASWTAYEGHGTRTLIAELMVAATVLRAECDKACDAADRPLDRELMREAIRQSDLLLMHLVDRPRMMQWLGRVEQT